MKITTPFGDMDVTAAEFSKQLDGVQRSAISNDEDCFLVVEGRRPHLALQCRPWQLERVEDERVYRATFPPAVHEMFIAFASGTPGWDAGIEWIDVTGRARKSRSELWIALLVAFAAIGVASFVGWWFLRRASG